MVSLSLILVDRFFDQAQTQDASVKIYAPLGIRSDGGDVVDGMGHAVILADCYTLPMTIIHPRARIGHVHLTVADLDRSLAFYRDLLGFQITARYGDSAVFLSAGGYHHHLALNTWSGVGAAPPPPGHSGLFHHAILYPSRQELAKVLQRLLTANYPLTGSADHGVSEAIYLNDPDQIGVELYADRPRETWQVDQDGLIKMVTKPLDVEGLLREVGKK